MNDASGSEIVWSFVHWLLHDQIHFVLEGIMVLLLLYILLKKPSRRFDEAEKLTEQVAPTAFCVCSLLV